MTFEEWADSNLLIISGPKDQPELKGPAVGFAFRETADEVVVELIEDGFDVEVIEIDGGYYVTEK